MTPGVAISAKPWVIWGSELSPFTLKLIRLFRHARLPFRFLPAEGSLYENLVHGLRVERVRRGQLLISWPEMDEDDEFPLVPFVFGPSGEILYDSTAIAHWINRDLIAAQKIIPDDPVVSFIVRLIDDYADEYGLYMVHHNRWKVSALDNDAGMRMSREFRFMTGPFQRLQARWFSARQTRRLPYLFSVAPEGFSIDGLPKKRQPPSKAGFPATHKLLEESFDRLLVILEDLLGRRKFVLGDQFTLADASLYGQLGMNLSDPAADRWIKLRSPRLHDWLMALHGAASEPIASSHHLAIDGDLKPLLDEICRTHVPLMQQNAQAHQSFKAQGHQLFNEAAFNKGLCLFDGVIEGHPYRSVAKSFQAKVWKDCLQHWHRLDPKAQATLQALLPDPNIFKV